MDLIEFAFKRVRQVPDADIADYRNPFKAETPVFQYTVEMAINGKVIPHYLDMYELFYTCAPAKNTRIVIPEFYILPQNDKHLMSYIFTCSCGIPDCARIEGPILIKFRKKTVEWRVPRNAGYHFLDKTFYSFDVNQYRAAQQHLKQQVVELFESNPNLGILVDDIYLYPVHKIVKAIEFNEWRTNNWRK